jgi:hypothetical protein
MTKSNFIKNKKLSDYIKPMKTSKKEMNVKPKLDGTFDLIAI